MHKHPKGFTLIELAIVIVIIALTLSFIIAGEQLVGNAKRNGIISDFKKYEVAYNDFVEKYNYMPGDYPDAVNTFGCSSCNGNGNEYIDISNNYKEMYFTWLHLALAGFIDGNYSGKNNANFPQPGIDLPGSPYQGAMYTMGQKNSIISSFNYVEIPGMAVGTTVSATPNIVNGSFLSPDEAYYIDRKIDNGYPTDGKIWAWGTYGTDSSVCITLVSMANPMANTYNLTTGTKGCMLFYWLTDMKKL